MILTRLVMAVAACPRLCMTPALKFQQVDEEVVK
jgi:hypothetical protein